MMIMLLNSIFPFGQIQGLLHLYISNSLSLKHIFPIQKMPVHQMFLLHLKCHQSQGPGDTVVPISKPLNLTLKYHFYV